MGNFFKCSVRYDDIAENGMDKKSVDEYIVDAMSYTEAEAVINKEIEGMSLSNVEIDIARYRIEEVVNRGEDRFFKVTLDMISLDDYGNEKRKAYRYLVIGARNIGEAVAMMEDYMKGTVSDYEITTVAKEKKMVSYVPYNKDVPEAESNER